MWMLADKAVELNVLPNEVSDTRAVRMKCTE